MRETTTTHHISVEALSTYIRDQSLPQEGRYFFSYRIRITNNRKDSIQLLSRHWIITDGRGRIEEVRGAGVIGQQPRLGPGESFEYESFCPLPTSTGTMKGSYEMLNDQGERLEVEIPQFFLVEPGSFH